MRKITQKIMRKKRLHMRNSKAQKVALIGVLFALAMVLSFIEGTVAPLLGLPPGVKPGLANIVVMYAVLFIGKKEALFLVLLKSFFAMLTRGVIAGSLSLGGGLLSLAVLIALLSIKKIKLSMLIVSSSSAICHNVGQLLVLTFIVTASPYSLYYLPVLLISGLIMGAVTSFTLDAIIPALGKLGIFVKK